jgi:hypothetical protein
MLGFIIFFLLVSPVYSGGTLTPEQCECVTQEAQYEASLHAPYVWGDAKLEIGASGDCSGKLFSIFRRCGVPVLRTTAERMWHSNVSGWDGRIVPFGEAKKASIMNMTTQSSRPFGHIGMLITDTYKGQSALMFQSIKPAATVSYLLKDPPSNWFKCMNGIKDLRRVP